MCYEFVIEKTPFRLRDYLVLGIISWLKGKRVFHMCPVLVKEALATSVIDTNQT